MVLASGISEYGLYGWNLWKKGAYITRTVDFVVPKSYSATATLTYATSSSGGTSGSRSYRSGSYRITEYYVTAYYRYIISLSASFAQTEGSTVTGSWTYGWKKKSDESTCTKTVFTKTDSETNFSNLKYITLSGANYANYSVTINCKSGFASVFAQPVTRASISPSVVNDHYEEYITKTTRKKVSSGSSSSGGSSSGSTGGSSGTTTPEPTPTPTPEPEGDSGASATDKIVAGTLLYIAGAGGGTDNIAYEGTKELAQQASGIPVVGGVVSGALNVAADVIAAGTEAIGKGVDTLKDIGSWLNPFD